MAGISLILPPQSRAIMATPSLAAGHRRAARIEVEEEGALGRRSKMRR